MQIIKIDTTVKYATVTFNSSTNLWDITYPGGDQKPASVQGQYTEVLYILGKQNFLYSHSVGADHIYARISYVPEYL